MGYLTLIITIQELKEAGHIIIASGVAILLALAFFIPGILLISSENDS